MDGRNRATDAKRQPRRRRNYRLSLRYNDSLPRWGGLPPLAQPAYFLHPARRVTRFVDASTKHGREQRRSFCETKPITTLFSIGPAESWMSRCGFVKPERPRGQPSFSLGG